MNAVEAIVELVSQETGIPSADIFGHKRTRPVSYARMAAMRLAYEMCSDSIQNIGKAFKRDHTAVAYAAGRLARKSPVYPGTLEPLVEKLRPRVRDIIGPMGDNVVPSVPSTDKAVTPAEIVDLIYRQISRQGYALHEIEDSAGLPRNFLRRYRKQNGNFTSRKAVKLELTVADKICRKLGFKIQAVPLTAPK